MRGFIMLCLMALANADNLGYNYQPDEQLDKELSYTTGLQALQQSDIDSSTQPLQQSPNLETPIPQPAILTAEYRKEFYSYDAPEDSLEDNENSEKIGSALKKNLRVVFIKAPENQGFENAVVNLAKQASQQRTAIYVLSKQSDIGNLAKQLQNQRAHYANKPEVHFVKYRTDEDAVSAQKAIQQQYQSLPGDSRNVNGGQAKVLNFSSRAPIKDGVIPPGPGYQYLPANPITNDYLPPTLRRFRL